MAKPEDIIKFRKEWEENRTRYWRENHPEEYENFQKQKQLREQQRLQGKIFNPFVKKWMESQIATARTGLIVTMILTALFKGQVVIWLILFIGYRCRIKKVKHDAMEADRRHDYR